MVVPVHETRLDPPLIPRLTPVLLDPVTTCDVYLRPVQTIPVDDTEERHRYDVILSFFFGPGR